MYTTKTNKDLLSTLKFELELLDGAELKDYNTQLETLLSSYLNLELYNNTVVNFRLEYIRKLFQISQKLRDYLSKPDTSISDILALKNGKGVITYYKYLLQYRDVIKPLYLVINEELKQSLYYQYSTIDNIRDI
ncbi:hypothetical protein QYS48_34465 [Marivirga arenosa]|uniref:Uncharacterized protein n=1 Tax=Marivirga arenosa TaxID=3059076 RepID=A0AA51N9H1_9BACT|nr:hypothetical protein [Marivirga sp. ABR2-2]WMN06975.1 hypothetical protein QYS48_34465 [Marivirga sp. ABR2-2]